MPDRMTGSARAGGRGLLVVLMACGLFSAATFTSVAPFLNEMSADLGVSEGVMGQLTTASSLAAALVGFALAPFVGALAPRRLLVVALAGIALASLLTGLVPWFPALLMFQFAAGAASATMSTTALLAVGRVWTDPAARARRQGYLIGAFGFGVLLGAPVLRWVASWGGWQAALVSYGLAAFAAAGLAALFLPALPAAGEARVALGGRLREAVEASRPAAVRLTLATSALSWAVWGVLSAFLAGFFLDRYPGSDAWIARIWFADGLGYLVGALGGGLLVARAGAPVRVLALAIPAQVVSLLGFVWLPGGPLVTLLAFAAWAALIGVSTNAVIALLNGQGTAHAGALLFLEGSLAKVGMVLGSLAGGLAIEQSAGYGAWSVLLVGTGIGALTSVAILTRAVSWTNPQRQPRLQSAEDLVGAAP